MNTVKFLRQLHGQLRDELGLSPIEYAMILVLIAIVVAEFGWGVGPSTGAPASDPALY